MWGQKNSETAPGFATLSTQGATEQKFIVCKYIEMNSELLVNKEH